MVKYTGDDLEIYNDIKREMHSRVGIRVPDKEKAPGWRSTLWRAIKTAAVVLPAAYLASKGLGYALAPSPITTIDAMIADTGKKIRGFDAVLAALDTPKTRIRRRL